MYYVLGNVVEGFDSWIDEIEGVFTSEETAVNTAIKKMEKYEVMRNEIYVTDWIENEHVQKHKDIRVVNEGTWYRLFWV